MGPTSEEDLLSNIEAGLSEFPMAPRSEAALSKEAGLSEFCEESSESRRESMIWRPGVSLHTESSLLKTYWPESTQ